MHHLGIKERQLYLLNVLRKRMDYPDLKRAVRDQSLMYGATVVLIEDKASGTQLIQELIFDGVHAVTRYKPEGDKLMRLNAQTAAIENGFVHLPRQAPWLEEFLHEITTFPKGKYNDQVDSTSQALAWIKQGSSAEAWIQFARQQWEDSLIEGQIARGIAPESARRRSTVQHDADDLIKIYQRGLESASMMFRPICAGCDKTITDNTRVTDGVDCWHVGCQGRVRR
jgi:predicted phage terminase large subunit-like protein